MTTPDAVDTARLAIGATATTFPLWSDAVAWFAGSYQVMVATGGLIVLTLTIRKLILENRIASRKLRDLDDKS